MRALPASVVLGLVTVGGLALIGCGGDSPSAAAIVTSDDGKATLTLAEGALPDGMSPAEVSLTRLDLGSEEEIAYRLEPDGTVLNTPATLAIDTFDSLWSGGSVIHVSESDIESLEPSLVFDDRFGTLRGVELAVPHFSDVALIPSEFFNNPIIVQPLLATVPMGTTSATIRVSRNSSGESNSGYGYRESWVDQFEWAPSVSWLATNLVESSVNLDYPSSTVDELDLQQSWSCVRKGIIAANLLVQEQYVRTTTSQGQAPRTEQVNAFVMIDTRNLCLEEDPIEDGVTSRSMSPPTAPISDIDINGHGAGATLFNASEAALVLNGAPRLQATSGLKSSHYECGSSTPEMTVVCPAGVQPMPAGEVFIYGMRLETPPAGDSTYRYIYSAVVDSDGEAANNWRVQGPYDWDLFQGTDRWYQLERAIGGAWSLTVSQVDTNQNIDAVAQSTVRAVIQNDVILFYISASEMSVPAPGYRMTSFKDRGNFNFADLAADVSGTDPTQALDITVRPDM